MTSKISDKNILDPQKIQHILYADDFQIYLQIPKDKILEGIPRIFDAARLVSKWARSASLQLNVGKTQAVIFGSKMNVNNLNIPDLPKVELEGGALLPSTDIFASLDVTLDTYCKLAWKLHVDTVTKKSK